MSTAIVLVQLGTPEDPTPRSVGRFLRAFLSDPYVINLPWPLRHILVNAIIVPFRRRQSAHAYQAVWSEQGSPLRHHSNALVKKLQQVMGNTATVTLAMRYGNPSIPDVLTTLDQDGYDKIVVLPMFPQYAAATTATIQNQVLQHYAGKSHVPALHIVQNFYNHPAFIAAWTDRIETHLQTHPAEHVLFSYHGLPVKQVKASERGIVACNMQDACPNVEKNNRFCYRAQCYATTRAITDKLGNLPAHSVAFQSRLGRIPWIQPYLEDALIKLREQGIQNLAVVSPAFVADCLETLEEIGIRAQEDWMKAGGNSLTLVPSLNSSTAWVSALKAMLTALL